MDTCDNCGATIKAGIKFCTKCGNPTGVQVQQVNNSVPPVQNNERIDQIKQQSMNYFGWFKNTIKNPTVSMGNSKYFGLVSFLLHTILITFSFYVLFNGFFSPIVKGIKANAESLDSAMQIESNIPTGAGLYFKILPTVLIIFAAYIAIGFFAKKFVMNSDKNIFEYTTELGSYSNTLIVVELIIGLLLFITMPKDISVGAVSSLTQSVEMLFSLLVVVPSVLSTASVVSVMKDKAVGRINKIYVSIITVLVNSAVVFMIINMVINNAESKFGTVFQKIIGQMFQSF